MKLSLKIFLIVFIMNACHTMEDQKNDEALALREEAVNTLRKILNEQQEWVKVHAAEFLIWTENTQGVKQAFLKELELSGDKPQYRIGIWRVLAQLTTGNESEKYKREIIKAFIDTTGKDRIHAIETMAKLKISPLPEYATITEAALKSDVKSLSAYTHWAIAYTNEDSLKTAKKYFLSKVLDVKEDILTRRIAAYVLRNSGSMDKNDWDGFAETALLSPDTTEGKLSFLTAALMTTPEERKSTHIYHTLFEQLLFFSNKKDKASRMDLATGLAVTGNKDHITLLKNWMNNRDSTDVAADAADVQATAAYAILKLE